MWLPLLLGAILLVLVAGFSAIDYKLKLMLKKDAEIVQLLQQVVNRKTSQTRNNNEEEK